MPDPSSIYSGYRRASRLRSVEKRAITTALKPYKIELKSLSGQSDSEIRKLAARSVLKRRKKLGGTP